MKFADIFAQVATHQGFSRACSIAEVFQSLGGDISAPGLGIDAPLQYCIQCTSFVLFFGYLVYFFFLTLIVCLFTVNQSDSVLRLLRLGANINCIGLDGRIVGENTAGTLAEAVSMPFFLSSSSFIMALPNDVNSIHHIRLWLGLVCGEAQADFANNSYFTVTP